MSLTSLPPVWESWKIEDLENLTESEVERLHVLLRQKLVAVEDRFEYNIFFKKYDALKNKNKNINNNNGTVE
jgi:hypothetical protein